MNRPRLVLILSAWAAISLLTSTPLALAAPTVADQVRQQFATFSKAADDLDPQPPTKTAKPRDRTRKPTNPKPSPASAKLVATAESAVVLERAPTWVRASDNSWIYTLDVAANRSLRRANPPAFVELQPRYAVGALLLPDVPPKFRDELISKTRQLAATVAGVHNNESQAPYLKQEVVLVCRRDRGAIERYCGRCMVSLGGLPIRKYFRVTFASNQAVLRIDTNLSDKPTDQLAGQLLQNPPDIPLVHEDRGKLKMGTFFDPSEYRFELKAYSHEGHPYLDVSQNADPFQRGDFDPTKIPFVDVAACVSSQDYKHWCWVWYTRYGRVNGVRGNHDPQTNQWEYPGVDVRIHRSLASYPLIGGEPTDIRTITNPDGTQHPYPFAGATEFAPPFYSDMESCNIAAIFTHGGHVGGRYRFRRQFDVWVKFEPPVPLGRVNLRHLFADGCNTMGSIAEPHKAVLLDTWVLRPFIGGIRTICGNDGLHTGLDREGWRFYGRYNKGESIADSWAQSKFDENLANNPVTIAYGKTLPEAVATLYTGRFSRDRANPVWGVVSTWVSSQVPPSQPADDPDENANMDEKPKNKH